MPKNYTWKRAANRVELYTESRIAGIVFPEMGVIVALVNDGMVRKEFPPTHNLVQSLKEAMDWVENYNVNWTDLSKHMDAEIDLRTNPS